MFISLGIALSLQIQTLDPKPLSSPKVVSEKIEAKVGKDIILTSEVRSLAETLTYFNKSERPENLRKKALDTLIERALMKQYLQKMNVTVSDRDVDQRIQAIRQANGAETNEQLLPMLAAQGLTFDEFRAQLRNQLENQQFISIMRRQALFTTDDASLKDYYKKNIKKFSNQIEVELKECFLPKSSETKAEDLAHKYQSSPKLFDECISKHSQSPSASSQGQIGRFRAGMLREDIEQKVFPLEKGQIATIVQPGAIQLLKVIEKRDLGPQKFEDVKEKIRESLESEFIQKEIQKTIAQLKATTFIQI